MARALRWDGACLYKLPPDEDFTAQDVREIDRLAQAKRRGKHPFDIVVGHANWQARKDPERERDYIASLAEAGATWWSMYIPPDSEKKMLQAINHGPLRPG